MSERMELGHLKLFKAGKSVKYRGVDYQIDHVMLSGYKLSVYLKDHPGAVNPDNIDCEASLLVADIIR